MGVCAPKEAKPPPLTAEEAAEKAAEEALAEVDSISIHSKHESTFPADESTFPADESNVPASNEVDEVDHHHDSSVQPHDHGHNEEEGERVNFGSEAMAKDLHHTQEDDQETEEQPEVPRKKTRKPTGFVRKDQLPAFNWDEDEDEDEEAGGAGEAKGAEGAAEPAAVGPDSVAEGMETAKGAEEAAESAAAVPDSVAEDAAKAKGLEKAVLSVATGPDPVVEGAETAKGVDDAVESTAAAAGPDKIDCVNVDGDGKASAGTEHNDLGAQAGDDLIPNPSEKKDAPTSRIIDGLVLEQTENAFPPTGILYPPGTVSGTMEVTKPKEEPIYGGITGHLTGIFDCCASTKPASRKVLLRDMAPEDLPYGPKPDFNGLWELVDIDGDVNFFMMHPDFGMLVRHVIASLNTGLKPVRERIHLVGELLRLSYRDFEGHEVVQNMTIGRDTVHAKNVARSAVVLNVFWSKNQRVLVIEAFTGTDQIPSSKRYRSGQDMILEYSHEGKRMFQKYQRVAEY